MNWRIINNVQGDVYSWGRGSTGRLGHGSEEDVCAPKGNISLLFDLLAAAPLAFKIK